MRSTSQYVPTFHNPLGRDNRRANHVTVQLSRRSLAEPRHAVAPRLTASYSPRSVYWAAHTSVIERPGVRIHRADYNFGKRVMDLTICLIALPFAGLLMAVCALLVWIDDGRPIFLVQPRTGLGGRRFKMLKFRTMVRNADELKKKYAHLNELTWPDFKITNDPRVTRMGRFLRRTSLDELPQLLNVIKGDMSLVGPRPTSFDASTYALWQTERLEVLPGITGLWQISGRSNIDFDERLRLDIQYIENRSLWLDLQILAGTVIAVFKQRGAC